MFGIKEFLLYFILPVASIAFIYVRRKFSYFEDKKVPHVKPKSWMGNMGGVGSTSHFFDKVQEIYEACKEKDVVCGFYSSIGAIYMTTDEELVKSVLIKDFNNFVNRGFVFNEEDEPLTAHLFSIEDERWRYLRNKLSPAFTSGKLKAMYPEILNKSTTLVDALNEKLKSSSSIDVKDMTNRFTVDIISSVAFGMDAGTLIGENNRLNDIFKEIFPDSGGFTMLKMILLNVFPKFSAKLGLRFFSKNISEFFMGVVGGNIKYREDKNDNRKDFLNMLIQLKNKGSIDGEFSSDVKKLTQNEILAQAFLFFLAGSDTSSTTIAFALSELSHNEEIQEKLRKEIEEKSENGEITYEALHEMKYLGQVVDETLRMYTPGFVLFRKASVDYKIPNSTHIIPKGHPVWIPSIGLHYDKRYWPNPRKFDPERFTQEEIEKRSPYVYLPFGEGPRNCIGMRFGLINVKLGIATIIKNFKLSPDPRMAYPIKMNPKNLQLEAFGGFWVKFEKI